MLCDRSVAMACEGHAGARPRLVLAATILASSLDVATGFHSAVCTWNTPVPEEYILVFDVHGAALGTVGAVEANPASDLLVLETGGLIPLRFVTQSDMVAGTLVGSDFASP